MKIAMVTGASSGIGKEFVRQISGEYHTLDEIWVIARRRDLMENLQKEVEIPLRIIDGDLKNPGFFETLKIQLKSEAPKIHMLVNSAGFGKSGKIETFSEKERENLCDMIDVNCRALTKITLLCLPYLTKGSRVIQMASAAAFCPQAGFSVYAATKAYVLSFSESLRAELYKKEIYVTAVCPGPVNTEFFQVSGALKNPLKKLALVSPACVVRKALKDSRRRKAVSVYGATMQTARFFCRLLPHGLLLRIMSPAK